jgi:putative ABC transport system ATP-binding protein
VSQSETSAASVPVIDARDLHKVYHLGEMDVAALNGVTVRVERGEFVAIMGASGSGKSTFMNLIGCLDRPTSGDYFLEGENVSRMTSDQLAAIRNRRLGFVFQGFNLLSRTSALENVELPLLYSGVNSEERRERARTALEMVGLADRADHNPNELSGGQQQRVAIARALVNNPSLVLADEPTGNLDSRSTKDILAVFKDLNDKRGITIVMVTHEPDVAAWTRRTVVFRDGLVIEDHPSAAPTQVPV